MMIIDRAKRVLATTKIGALYIATRIGISIISSTRGVNA
jgi:hypothetical protein